MVLLCFPYTSATNSLKKPMQPSTANTETYSSAPMVLKALQIGGSRVSCVLPSPTGIQYGLRVLENISSNSKPLFSLSFQIFSKDPEKIFFLFFFF